MTIDKSLVMEGAKILMTAAVLSTGALGGSLIIPMVGRHVVSAVAENIPFLKKERPIEAKGEVVEDPSDDGNQEKES